MRTQTVVNVLKGTIASGGIQIDESPLFRGKARKQLSDAFLVMPVTWSGAQYNALTGGWMQDLPSVGTDGTVATRFLRIGVTTYRPEPVRFEAAQVYSAFGAYNKEQPSADIESGREVRQIHMMLASCDTLRASQATNSSDSTEAWLSEKLNASVTFAGEFKGSHIGYRVGANSEVPPEVVRSVLSAWAMNETVHELCTFATSYGRFHRLETASLDMFKTVLSQFATYMAKQLGIRDDMSNVEIAALLPPELLVLKDQPLDSLASWWDIHHPMTEVTLERDDNIQYRLFLGNCPYAVSPKEIRDMLAPANEQIIDVQIPLDPYTLRPKGIAFAVFRNKGALSRVCAFLKSSPLVIAGREIRASQSIRKG